MFWAELVMDYDFSSLAWDFIRVDSVSFDWESEGASCELAIWRSRVIFLWKLMFLSWTSSFLFEATYRYFRYSSFKDYLYWFSGLILCLIWTYLSASIEMESSFCSIFGSIVGGWYYDLDNDKRDILGMDYDYFYLYGICSLFFSGILFFIGGKMLLLGFC